MDAVNPTLILKSVSSAPPYKYILSLPERAIRSLGALSGGLLREIGNVALPASVRRTTLYRTMVEVALRFLIEEVGQVEGVYPSEGRLAEDFLLKRTASHGIELLGILAFHASPVWVLAALADATGGGRKLILEIAEALKEEGLLDREARFETMDQVLLGLEKTSDHMATTLNMPPVDIAGLRREWDQLKQELATIPPKKVPALERIEGVGQELQTTAQQQGRSVFVRVVAPGGFHRGPRSRQCAVVVARCPFRGPPHRARARRSGTGSLHGLPWRNRAAPVSLPIGRANSGLTCAAQPSSSLPGMNRSPRDC